MPQLAVGLASQLFGPIVVSSLSASTLDDLTKVSMFIFVPAMHDELAIEWTWPAGLVNITQQRACMCLKCSHVTKDYCLELTSHLQRLLLSG